MLAQGLMVHMAHVLELQKMRHDWHTFDITVRRLIVAGHLQWNLYIAFALALRIFKHN